MRLTRGREFLAVRREGFRASAGPLLCSARPNGLSHARLGLAISARVGKAVTRNIIKRRLREAFRVTHGQWPQPGGGYDLLISARPHKPLALAEYQRLLARAMRDVHASWLKRRQ
jgi:ribonuclease P protein component